MRDFKGMKRQRGRNRKPGGNQSNSANPNRSWDSQGPENIKVRGNAQTVYERYQQLARDASSSSDRVLAENYLQHAEHYFRVLRALQPQRSFQEIAQREQIGQGFDIDFEDESGAQAAAFAAAQQAADRQAQPQQNAQQTPQQPNQGQDAPQNQADSDGDGNGRRETRRERWERRRDGRRGPYERDESEGGAAQSDQTRDENAASSQETPASGGDTSDQQDRPRRARRPRSGGDDNEGSGEIESSLPGFLTRATPQPAGDTASEPSAEDKPAPRRRAPRRKAADTPVGEDV